MTTKDEDGIWIIDNEARTLFANARMGEILGTSASELAGRQSFEYVFEEDAEAAQKLFDRKRAGELNAFHFRLRRANGSPIWVDVQGTPMHNPEGGFLGIVGTFRVSSNGQKS
jgi:PAS domain S-box-containing protein